MNNVFGEVTADTIGNAAIDELQSFGMTFRKAEYIRDFSLKILGGSWRCNTGDERSCA